MTTPDTYPDTDPRHWRARRVERRRRRVFTMPVLPIDDPGARAYLWRVLPAEVGSAVTDPIDAERHRLVDYMAHKHTPRLCGMLELDGVTPADLAQHLLALDLYALRMLLVDIGLHMEPTMTDRRSAARALERRQDRATAAQRLADTGDVLQDYLMRDGVLYKIERLVHKREHGPDVITTHARPVYNTWATWCKKTWRSAHIRRALTFPWARTPDGQVLTTTQIRARVNPYSQAPVIGRSYEHTETT